ncbi:hypothetical protein LOZ58_002487 [Ophidiomyces ophidiicola]|nr:hypothetical protein LOZ58_002487 [Ophidiomyces ophidiicola]
MISERVVQLCQEGTTVSSEMAKDQNTIPHDTIVRLLSEKSRNLREYPNSRTQHHFEKDLNTALECGKWGSQRPSDLFLKIYHDALCPLMQDPMSGLVSPPLMGSSGVVPLTIIGTLPDICRHLANCIVRAEKEIIFLTSYWIYSNNSKLLTNAMRELSKRTALRGTRVVMKMMYDRGNVKQVLNNRQPVSRIEALSERVRLPSPEEIPNIDLQVLNYHRPVVGTLHSKVMIVDRKMALLMSNNIQVLSPYDNDNLEMMVRFEGSIVDSFYDMALISWDISLKPPLPMIESPASLHEPPSFANNSQVNESNEAVELPQKGDIASDSGHFFENIAYDIDIASETERVKIRLTPVQGETRRDCVSRHLNVPAIPSAIGDAPEWEADDHMLPYFLHPHHQPFPMAMVNREPWGALNHSSIYTPQNTAFLAAIESAEHSIFIQTPDLNAEPLLKPLIDAVRRGVVVTCYLCLGYNDAGQLLPFQNGTNEMVCNRLYNSLSCDEEKVRLRIYNYVAKDQTKPIHNSFKKRSCHIKLMIIDEKVAIQGTFNTIPTIPQTYNFDLTRAKYL